MRPMRKRHLNCCVHLRVRRPAGPMPSSLSSVATAGTSGALSPCTIGHYRLGLRREYAVTSTVLPPLVEGRPLGS